MTRRPPLRDVFEDLVPRVPEVEEWEDVLARASNGGGARRRRRSVIVLALTAVAALAAMASAYAVGHFLTIGDRAPDDVREQARLADEIRGELIPRANAAPAIDFDRLRLAAFADSSIGPIYLWVAPSASGDECVFLHFPTRPADDGRPNVSGGCRGYQPDRLTVSFSETTVKGRPLRLVQGAAPRDAVTVGIVFDDDRLDVALDRSRFFLVEVDEQPAAVVAAGDAGQELGSFELTRSVAAPDRSLPYRVLISRATGRGTVSLAVADAASGAKCWRLRSPEAVSETCGRWRVGRTGVDVTPAQHGAGATGFLILHGRVGDSVAALHLRYEDGEDEPLPIREGWVLVVVEPDRFASGRRPDALVAREKHGAILGVHPLGPWQPPHSD
ncbi:MAG TPA: hypothetical protein VM290_05625 [Gaiellaceae bacterium]|nr:hypothetical protein [Gaiellaceae bacterium]